MEHLTPDVLLRFLLGVPKGQENRQVVKHLLARCPACAAALRRLRHEPPLGPPPRPEAYDPALERAAAFLGELTREWRPPRSSGPSTCRLSPS